MVLWQCSYCEVSLRSDEEWQEHEKICIKSGKTEQERFYAKKRLAEGRKVSSFSQLPFLTSRSWSPAVLRRGGATFFRQRCRIK